MDGHSQEQGVNYVGVFEIFGGTGNDLWMVFTTVNYADSRKQLNRQRSLWSSKQQLQPRGSDRTRDNGG